MPFRDTSIPILATGGLALVSMTHTTDLVEQSPAAWKPGAETLPLALEANPTLAFSLQPSALFFPRLAITDPADLRFGVAPKPLTTRRGLTIGGGIVYPELNFTLPPMLVNESTMPEVRQQYQQIITGALHRAVELEAPGLVVEFETLPPMTENPAWGIELTRILLDGMAEAHAKHGLKSVLRITPNDTREMERPPRMRSGPLYEAMLATFDGCAAAGAELLSIESVGGKEVHDEALMMGDLRGVIFGLCVLGVRDMRFLWTELDRIARKHGVHCAGDTACGFGNTAMVLAEQKMIPRVFAAVVRAVSAVRTLVCYECGAVGPGKDCGYENPILKAITGFPMAMEGKTAACAHLSPLGQHRRRHLRHLEQRVGAEHQAPRRHGPHLLRRATDLRLPPDERGPGRWPRRRAALPQMDGRLRRLPRPAGLRAHARQRHCHRASHRQRPHRLRRRQSRRPHRRAAPARRPPRRRPQAPRRARSPGWTGSRRPSKPCRPKRRNSLMR